MQDVYQKRTLNLYMTAEERTMLGDKCTNEQLNRAIGYLTQWGLGSVKYGHVDIYVRDVKQPELLACYRSQEGSQAGVNFVIGAVWDNNTEAFGFHS